MGKALHGSGVAWHSMLSSSRRPGAGEARSARQPRMHTCPEPCQAVRPLHVQAAEQP